MSKISSQATAFFLLLFISIVPIFSQTPVCKKAAFSALRPIPKLNYKCREDLTDSDDEVLTQPNRIAAINLYVKDLEKFTFNNWWQTNVNDLNICDFKRKPGALSKDEKNQFKNGEYSVNLFGNNEIRVIWTADPCYQAGFSGSNIFLLYRRNGRVHTTEIIDGFFSRAETIFVDFAMDGNEQIIEVATSSGGLQPTVTNYYFTINKKTNRAIPKKLFQDDNKKLSHRITSMMLLDDAESYGLPPHTEPLEIIKNNRLNKKFDIIVNTYETIGQEKREKFSRLTLRWNGKFYQ